MKLLRIFSLVVILPALLVIGCKTHKPESLPKNLDEAIAYFEVHWSSVEKTKFIMQVEDKAVTELHFSVGMWIRNTWIHGDRDTSLTNYFHTLGIFHPDDMSAIILTSLHRKLNNRNIDLQAQVKSYQDYWAPIIECQKRHRKEAVTVFHQHSLSDRVTITMPVDTSDGERNAFIYDCPNDQWNFDPTVDLAIVGIITKKYFLNDSSNVFFGVKIKSLNHRNTTVLMENVSVGDTFDFPLAGLSIK